MWHSTAVRQLSLRFFHLLNEFHLAVSQCKCECSCRVDSQGIARDLSQGLLYLQCISFYAVIDDEISDAVNLSLPPPSVWVFSPPPFLSYLSLVLLLLLFH